MSQTNKRLLDVLACIKLGKFNKKLGSLNRLTANQKMFKKIIHLSKIGSISHIDFGPKKAALTANNENCKSKN